MHCLDCQCWQRKEVDLCPTTSCALWAYRKGHRPSKEDIDIVENTEDEFYPQKKKLGFFREVAEENAQNLAIYRANKRNNDDETV